MGPAKGSCAVALLPSVEEAISLRARYNEACRIFE